MPSLRKDLRNDLEKTILRAREIAEAGAREALTALAVGEAKPFNHLSSGEKTLRKQLRARGRQAGDALDERTDKQTTNHLESIVAYEHWHRMLFARFLAENGCLLEPEHQVPVSLADVDELARDEKIDVWELAGRFAQRMLPQVFRADDPVLAVSIARESRVKLEKLVGDLPTDVFTASDSLGWTYQFWQADQKEIVNKSGNKIGADELPSVTQLFTEDYMVDFLLDNTLGAWHASKVLAANRNLAENALSEDELRQAVALPGCTWNYLRFIKQKDGKWTPASGRFAGWPKIAKGLTCLDPCMGSGHFVVAMFERLVALRQAEERLDETAAVTAVIRDNLFGLEIDPRCTQIGAFNLALAAWRRVGHCKLPTMNLACSGLAPNTREADWLAIAGENEKLQRGMERLYRLFQKATVLGSLINPRAGESDLLIAAFHELQPLLDKALAQETKDDPAHEMAVAAHGLAKAAGILAGRFTLVATNVPYLARGKQCSTLQEYSESFAPNAKMDLATVFLQRCRELLTPSGVVSVVTPQNWLFLSGYTEMRIEFLRTMSWLSVGRLGSGAFETISGEIVNTSLLILSGEAPSKQNSFMALDASSDESYSTKAQTFQTGDVSIIQQSEQLNNPDSRIVLAELANGTPLRQLASALSGCSAGDGPRFIRLFWEIPKNGTEWEFHQSTVPDVCNFGGKAEVIFWERERGEMFRLAESVKHLNHAAQNWLRGKPNWKKKGIVISQMGDLPATIYLGDIYDCNCCAIVPDKPEHLPALWAFCVSGAFTAEVRKINQKLNVTPGTLLDVAFDLVHWQKVAAEEYPNGLPKPFSSDPTQWLFNGHPKGADRPLHVAVARMLGYRWPRQTGSGFLDCPAISFDGLEGHVDEDGIVCLTALRGDRGAADRLHSLLSVALGHYDEQKLIAETGSRARNLDDWLCADYFEQHCKAFQQQPFIWHIWDGLADGFHALVNYHKLAAPDGAGRKLLETLTFSYLGDWIKKQQDDIAHKKPGAEDKLVAAQGLQTELKAILAGETPYDIFVRWKPLHQQAIGWEPDINDGVRMNIRPFMLASDVGRKGAGILRAKPSIKWDKDRGKEPERPKVDFPWFWSWDGTTEDFGGGSNYDGNRWNDCHYTPAAKRAAREKHKKTP